MKLSDDLNKFNYDEVEDYNYSLQYSASSVFGSLKTENSLLICPKFGFDIYPSRFLMLSLSYYRTHLSADFSETLLSGHFAFGISYLIPFGKNDEARVLQQYKKQ
ncbi:MAG: hypothetical protein GX879_05445 [Bacteroidales bacterium]|nr:hypothetical protein [Bacteroidales bacterium]